MLICSGHSPVPALVRPPPADDVSYDVVAEELDESVEQQSVSVHGATTSRLVIFYCVMRMHSVDYAVARCLSVCPSIRHTPVLCLNDYTYR